MDVVNDATHRYNSDWLHGYWTLQNDPPRVLNVFRCTNPKNECFGLYLILVSVGCWKSTSTRPIFEEFNMLDPLTAQSVVYEMLEKYSDAPVRNEVRAVDGRRLLEPLSPSNQD